MTALQIFLIIYFTGYIASYFVVRNTVKSEREYTVSDRALTMMFSCLSWVSVFCCLLLRLIVWIVRNKNKPAKW